MMSWRLGGGGCWKEHLRIVTKVWQYVKTMRVGWPRTRKGLDKGGIESQQRSEMIHLQEERCLVWSYMTLLLFLSLPLPLLLLLLFSPYRFDPVCPVAFSPWWPVLGHLLSHIRTFTKGIGKSCSLCAVLFKLRPWVIFFNVLSLGFFNGIESRGCSAVKCWLRFCIRSGLATLMVG